MAGAKINTKAKGKDDKSKGNKTSTNEENEDHDFSLLRKPVLTSITGFAQARKIFDFATEELKGLLANECDLLYECKVCRNIFRSLANFISHKRVYCKEKFNSSVHSHFVKNSSASNEILKIKQMEEAYQESLKVTNFVSNENEERIPLTKDLTGIMEKLTKVKGRYSFDEQQVTLQKIPNSSVAVFQSHCEEKKLDNMLSQVHELDKMLAEDKAVLQSDGSFNVQSSENADKADDNVIQISDDDDSDEGGVPKCKICDMQFSTQKTLKFHMKYKHHESRLVYPCPDCFEIFSTSWSVYRHLFKVHRKSAAQIRRLREAIQAKAFRMNNPPAIYEKKKNSKPITPQKISEEERLDQENQAWMDNMEGDAELPRCGGCGRTFERRAALAAHTHTCQPRSRALQRRPDAKRIEIQIRKDYHKGPGGHALKDTENKQTTEETQTVTKARPEKNADGAEKSALVEKSTETEDIKPDDTRAVFAKSGEPMEISSAQDVPHLTRLTEESAEKPTESVQKVPDVAQKDAKICKEADAAEKETKVTKKETVLVQKAPELNNKRKIVLEEATMDIIDDRSSDSIDSPEKATTKPQPEKKVKKLPFAHQAEKSNLAAFKHRMRLDIDMEKLLCKKCLTKHGRTHELYQHMAGHYKWLRYACKLCNFKSYEFEKLPEHVKVVHKLKGDSDFYFSTVKAIDGVEALELAEPEPVEESDINEDSSESRRPSRCSSDSSRLSDDSSSSSTRVEGSRKRKMYQNRSSGKKKKNTSDDTVDKESNAMDKTSNNIGDSESPTALKTFEENSSDMDDLEDRIAKRSLAETTSVASRRPVRKKTKPKNEDFEYDLSNLLKLEAQGYRDSQTVTFTKSAQSKKKLQELQNNYDILNKEHVGALALLTKKAVDIAAAEFKTTDFSSPVYNIQKESRIPNIFARPMVPKASRGDKISPRKDNAEESIKDIVSSNRLLKILDVPGTPAPVKEVKIDKDALEEKTNDRGDVTPTKTVTNDTASAENDPSLNSESTESAKSKVKMPAVLPLKFRRQSLELMKNPIINKNISDFSKAGMKTKILLIKPINRNKDRVSVNTPLKFQTIKLKEQNKDTASNDDKPNDQIVVVKVPKVDRSVPRNKPEINVNKPENNVNTPENNLNKPENNVNTPETNVNKPETNVNKPENNVNKPENNVKKPEENVNKPEKNVNKPEKNVNKPEKNVNKPEKNVNKPEKSVNKLENDANKLENDANKPENNVNKPENDVNKPENNVNKSAKSDSSVNVTNIATDASVQPIDSSKKNATKSEVNAINKSDVCSKSNDNVVNINPSSSSNMESPSLSETPSSATETDLGVPENNIGKNGCGIKISSDKPEPMEIEESDKSAPDTVVSDSDSIKRGINSKPTSSVQDIVQKPTELVSENESSVTSDAIPPKEPITDAAVMPNHTSV